MPSEFDEFDAILATSPAATGSESARTPVPARNPEPSEFAEFDSILNEPVKPVKPEPSSALRRTVGDVGVGLARGIPQWTQAVIGAVDLAHTPGLLAGQMARNAVKGQPLMTPDAFSPGIVGRTIGKVADFKATDAAIGDLLSPEAKEAQRRVSESRGLIGKIKTSLENPSSIVQGVAQSAATMLGGGALGKLAARPAMAAAQKAAKLATTPAAKTLAKKAIERVVSRGPFYAAIGEGGAQSGSITEQVRQETPGGVITPKTAALGAASGVTTAALGYLGNRLADALGFADINTGMVVGFRDAVKRNRALQVIGSMIQEGLLEEGGQSATEQMYQNVATGRPMMEGVPDAVAQGILAGMAMGGGANLIAGRANATPTTTVAGQPAPAVESEATLDPETEALIVRLQEEQALEAERAARPATPLPPAPGIGGYIAPEGAPVTPEAELDAVLSKGQESGPIDVPTEGINKPGERARRGDFGRWLSSIDDVEKLRQLRQDHIDDGMEWAAEMAARRLEQLGALHRDQAQTVSRPVVEPRPIVDEQAEIAKLDAIKAKVAADKQALRQRIAELVAQRQSQTPSSGLQDNAIAGKVPAPPVQPASVSTPINSKTVAFDDVTKASDKNPYFIHITTPEAAKQILADRRIKAGQRGAFFWENGLDGASSEVMSEWLPDSPFVYIAIPKQGVSVAPDSWVKTGDAVVAGQDVALPPGTLVSSVETESNQKPDFNTLDAPPPPAEPAQGSKPPDSAQGIGGEPGSGEIVSIDVRHKQTALGVKAPYQLPEGKHLFFVERGKKRSTLYPVNEAGERVVIKDVSGQPLSSLSVDNDSVKSRFTPQPIIQRQPPPAEPSPAQVTTQVTAQDKAPSGNIPSPVAPVKSVESPSVTSPPAFTGKVYDRNLDASKIRKLSYMETKDAAKGSTWSDGRTVWDSAKGHGMSALKAELIRHRAAYMPSEDQEAIRKASVATHLKRSAAARNRTGSMSDKTAMERYAAQEMVAVRNGKDAPIDEQDMSDGGYVRIGERWFRVSVPEDGRGKTLTAANGEKIVLDLGESTDGKVAIPANSPNHAAIDAEFKAEVAATPQVPAPKIENDPFADEREDAPALTLESQTPEQVKAERAQAEAKAAKEALANKPPSKPLDTTGDMFDQSKAENPLFAVPPPKVKPAQAAIGTRSTGIPRSTYDTAVASESRVMPMGERAQAFDRLEDAPSDVRSAVAGGTAYVLGKDTQGQVRAVTIGDRSYFFLDRYANEGEIRQDIREEFFHRIENEYAQYGKASTLGTLTYGGKWSGIKNEITRNYGLRPGQEGFFRELAAKAYRDGLTDRTVWGKFLDAIVATVKATARRMGVKLDLSDAEIRDHVNGVLMAKVAGVKGTEGGGVLRTSNATITRPGQQPAYMVRAAHGTPYTFPPEQGAPFGRFRRVRGKTGAGMDHGYGWYVAMRQEVAESYRDVLSQGLTTVDGQEPKYGSLEWLAADAVVGANGDWQKAVKELRRRAGPDSATVPHRRADMSDSANWLEKNHARVELNRGNIYHVELDFSPRETIDWDAPIDDQPALVRTLLVEPYVKQAVAAYTKDGSVFEQGADLYYAISRAKAVDRGESTRGRFSNESDQEASNYLAQLGIKGIRYADAFSRNATDPKTYNFVVFNEQDIRVVGRNGETLSPTDAMEPMAQFARGEQEFTSADTSIPQAAATHKDPNLLKPNTRNADIGGGRFDIGTELLAKRGIVNIVTDPYNRSEEHNAKAKADIAANPTDTATVNNVLNVIKEPDARAAVIQQASQAIKPEGTAYFLIHEGSTGNGKVAGDGVGRETTKGWQNYKRASEYIPEIRRYFSDVTRKGNLLIARGPIRAQFARGEAPVTPDNITRINKDTITAEREAKGYGPQPERVPVSDEALMQQANDAIAADKSLMDRTVDDFQKEMRAPQPNELGILVRAKQDRRVELDKANADIDAAEKANDPAALKAARDRWAYADKRDREITQIFSVGGVGSQAGLLLQKFRIAIDDDFSVVHLQRSVEAKQGWKPLNAKQKASLADIAKQYQNGERIVQERMAEHEAEVSKLRESRDIADELLTLADQELQDARLNEAFLRDVLNKMPEPDMSVPVSKTIQNDAKAAGQAARERMKARRSSVIDAEMLKDAFDVGYEFFIEEAVNLKASAKPKAGQQALFARGEAQDGVNPAWAEKMVAIYGEQIRPRLQEIQDAARKRFGYQQGLEAAKVRKPAAPRQPAPRKPGNILDRAEITEMFKDQAKAGVRDGKVALENVSRIVQEVYPDVSSEQVRDIFTGKDKEKGREPDLIVKATGDMRRQLQTITNIERLGKLLHPILFGPKRTKPSATARELMRKFNKLFKQAVKDGTLVLDQDALDARRASALDAVKTRMLNRIEQLKKAIDTKTRYTVNNTPIEYDAATKDLIAQRDALQTVYDEMFPPEPLTYEQRVEQAVKATDRAIAAQQQKVDEAKAGKFKDTATGRASLWSPDIGERKLTLQALRDAYDELELAAFPPPTALQKAIDAKRKRYETATKEFNRRLREKDFAKRQVPHVDISGDKAALDALEQMGIAKARFLHEKRRAAWMAMGKLGKVGTLVGAVWDTSRDVLSSGELSAIGRQGYPAFFINPHAWVKANRAMFRSLSRKSSMAVVQEFKQRKNYTNGFYKRGRLPISEDDGSGNYDKMDDRIKANIVNHIPILGASNRAYAAFLNNLRAELFDWLLAQHDSALNPSDALLREIGDTVGILTGKGRLGGSSEVLQRVVYAPSFFKSSLDIITFKPVLGTSDKQLKWMMAKAYGKLLSGTGMLALLATIMGGGDGDDIEWDLTSSDFGMVDLGHYKVGLFGFVRPLLTFLARSMTGYMKTDKGKVRLVDPLPPWTSPEGMTTKVPWGQGIDQVNWRFIKSKLHPAISGVSAVSTGRDFGGYPISREKAIMEMFTPITWKDLSEASKIETLDMMVLLTILMAAGFDVRMDYNDPVVKRYLDSKKKL